MNRTIPRAVLCLDLLWLIVALGMSYALRYGAVIPYGMSFYSLIWLAGAGFWIALFAALKLDCLEGGWRLHVVLSKVGTGTIFLMAFVMTFAYLARLYYSRLMLSYFAALLFCGLLIIRSGTYIFLRRQHRKGRARRVVLLGNERFIREFISKIRRHPELLYDVVGTLSAVRSGEVTHEASTEPYNTALSSEDTLAALLDGQVAELIVLLDESPGLEIQSFIARCRTQDIAVSVLPYGYQLYTSKPRLLNIDGFPLVSLEQRRVGPAAMVLKRAMDLVISVLLLLPAAVIIALNATIMLMKRRRVFRRELRIGINGQAFWMYRFDIVSTNENMSAYERFLLRVSVSEIPQIWNVVRGEMSLVGPRPESPNRVKNYSEWQRQRLKAKPGMTGLAQVNGLRNGHASEEKTHYDLQYILEWTPLMDVVVLLKTLTALGKRCSPRNSAAEVSLPKDSPRSVSRHDIVTEMVHADRT